MSHKTVGKAFLVGSGPGDPGLITLRGVECLQQADVVLYDYLVNPAILDHAPPQAERICLGRHGQGRILAPEEVHRLMIDAARAGSTVVRLKGGDPAVFARGADEATALFEAGINFEIVPGITAALAAGSYAGMALTDRRLASAMALVTGHEAAEKSFVGLDYDALAVFPGTLVFYMGVTTVQNWAPALVAAGKPSGTLVTIVRKCSWPDQTITSCTLGELVDVVTRTRLRPPVTFVIGPVAQQVPALDWFMRRPLFGRRIVVTRPRHQADGLVRPLARLGAEVLVQPAIEIGPPPDWAPVDDALRRLSDFRWMVFSSANGVRFLLDRLLDRHGDLRRLGGIKLAAIGPGSNEELGRYRLQADVVPEQFRAESLAEALAGRAAGGRALLVRASRGREVLATQLAAAGVAVEQIVAYRSTDVTEADPDVASRLAAGQIDWITVTSSAIARSLVALWGDDLRKARLASISPITSETLRLAGHHVAAEAAQYTMSGVVAAIERVESG